MSPLRTLAVLALAAGLILGCGGGTHESSQTQTADPPAITSSMGAPEPMPMRLRHQFARNGHRFSATTLPFAEAQHLGSALTGGLWLVEGQRLTCVILDHPSASACDTSDEVRRRGIYVQTFESAETDPELQRNFIAAGVLPAGYESLHTQVGREHVNTRVFEGIFVVRSQRPIEVLLPN